MLRRILLTLAGAMALVGHAQRITAPSITDVAPQEKAAARDITLTGTLHRTQRAPGRWVGLNDDFRQLRDLCFSMERLDLSQADVDTIPACAFHSCKALREVILPPTLKHIGRQAFYACDALETVTFKGQRPTMDPYAFGQTRFADWSLPAPAATALEGGAAAALLPVPETVRPLGGTFRTDARVRTSINPALPPEGYHLRAKGRTVTIEGGDEAGVFYGRMTLEQMLRHAEAATPDGHCLKGGGVRKLPAVDIVDAPRTPIRELMIDPARIFIPFDDLKGFIVEMARYKLNTLHLHLVDDQAWRIEIKAYPELTERSSFRVGMDDMLRPIGGYYTQEQMRELCAFARQYHVTIVPEIELPGHEVAAIHALPWLTCSTGASTAAEGASASAATPDTIPLRTICGVSNELLCPSSERTYEFLETVLRELADVFPGPYVHLGGDEAGNPSLDCWTHCASCQQLKAQLLGTDTLNGKREGNWRLQQYMFDRVISLLRDELGKTPMFWYETDFRDIQPGCITFAWRHGLTQAAIDAAKRCQARIILCPGEHCYLDYPMGHNDMPEVNWGMPTTTLKQTYSLDPAWGNGAYTAPDGTARDFERDCLMGVAGTLWTECIPSTERLYYMAYPRALALAEAGWSQQARRSWPDFERRAAIVADDMLRRGICADR